jgi:hypothetical protein
MKRHGHKRLRVKQNNVKIVKDVVFGEILERRIL